jgi:thymidylate kinase
VVRRSPQRGGVIVVAGPDGTGKSTLCDALTEQLGTKVVRLHHRPGVLPVRGGTGPSTEPHAARPYPAALGALKSLFLFTDYALGWTTRIRPVIGRGEWVLMERGWWDLAVDPARYRLRATGLTRALGRLLPRADLTLVLEASPEVLIARKDELPAAELERQAAAWRKVLPKRTPRLYIDARRPVALSVQEVLARLSGERHESSARGWLNLPTKKKLRWYVPRGPRAVTETAFHIYQPMTPKALMAWRLGRWVAARGTFRLLPTGEAPPVEVTALLAAEVPEAAHVAIARAHDRGRFVCLVIDRDGAPLSLAKIDLDEGSTRLAREADALERLSPRLPAPLSAPALLARGDTLLRSEPVMWRPRSRPWHLPVEVARAMGRFYAPQGDGPGRGNTHGDFAPWNLARTAEGWSLFDWEAASEDGPPFHDLWHYLVQAHVLLGHPTADELEGGLTGEGWVGDAIAAYAEGAGFERTKAGSSLIDYLTVSREELDPDAPYATEARTARDRLLARVESAQA